MGRLNDLTQGTLNDILRRLRRLENASPLSSSSVGRGRMRFYDGSVLLIENGALQVTGTATISGTLKATGVIDFTGTLTQTGTSTFTGPTNLNGVTTIRGNTSVTGDFTVTGPTKLDGKTDIGGNTSITGDLAVKGPATISGKLDVTGPMATKGTLSVEGVTTLKNDLNVTSGGKITAGNVTIDPAHVGGALRFSNSTYIGATPNGAQLSYPSGGTVGTASSQAFMSYGGYGWIIDGSGLGVQGASSLPTTGSAANVYINPSTGRLYLST